MSSFYEQLHSPDQSQYRLAGPYLPHTLKVQINNYFFARAQNFAAVVPTSFVLEQLETVKMCMELYLRTHRGLQPGEYCPPTPNTLFFGEELSHLQGLLEGIFIGDGGLEKFSSLDVYCNILYISALIEPEINAIKRQSAQDELRRASSIPLPESDSDEEEGPRRGLSLNDLNRFTGLNLTGRAPSALEGGSMKRGSGKRSSSKPRKTKK